MHSLGDRNQALPQTIGVCYTPPAIVDYVVRQTVGKLLDGKQPQQIGQSLRILDPACGEGVFLVRAYAYLLNWYQEQYVLSASRTKGHTASPIWQDDQGCWHLTLAEKQRILQDHIYGVDIDAIALGKAQQALSNKAIQAIEPSSPIAAFDLGANLQLGNAIIDWDFYADDPIDQSSLQIASLAPETVKPFTWQAAFPGILPAGGFDVVIGNPPYVSSEWMSVHLPHWRDYCAHRYQTAWGNWDLFCIFIEKAIALCRAGGLTSFIVPNKLGSAHYATKAREILTQHNRLLLIRDYSRVPVFAEAVYPIVYIAQKEPPCTSVGVTYERMSINPEGAIACHSSQTLDYERYFSQPERSWPIFSHIDGSELTKRLQNQFPALKSAATVLGAATVSEAYAIQPLIQEGLDTANEDGLKLLNSGTIDRYRILWGRKPLRYLGQVYQHPIVPERQARQLPHKRWQQAKQPKLIVAGMTKVIECAPDLAGSFLAGKSTSIILTKLSLYYLLALLNSKLITFYYQTVFGGDRLHGGYLRIGPSQLRSLPIPHVQGRNFEVVYHQLIALAEQRFLLQNHLDNPQITQALNPLKQQIDTVEHQINHLIYNLYELTDAEIDLVETIQEP